MNLAKPGTYNTELNKALKLNNIAPVVLPNNPPSQEILSLATLSNKKTSPHKQQQQQQESNIAISDEEEMEDIEVEEETEEEETQATKIKGTDTGLQIVTKKSTGWPEGNIYQETIMHGIKQGKYKYFYSSQDYTAAEIYKMLKNNEINLQGV